MGFGAALSVTPKCLAFKRLPLSFPRSKNGDSNLCHHLPLKSNLAGGDEADRGADRGEQYCKSSSESK